MQKFKQKNYKPIVLVVILTFSTLNSIAGTQEQELLSPDVQTAMQTTIINPIEPHLVFKTKDQATAWLDDMSNRLKKWVPDKFLRERYLTIIQYESVRAGLDPQLVLSLISIESKFNKYAISSTGAQGLMQVMPFWLTQLGLTHQSLFDTQTNIRFGCTILRYYLQKENGNMFMALGRYNGSRGQTAYPTLVFNAYDKYWKPYPVMTMQNGKVKVIDYTKND